MNKKFLMREKKAECVKNERHAMDLCAHVPGGALQVQGSGSRGLRSEVKGLGFRV